MLCGGDRDGYHDAGVWGDVMATDTMKIGGGAGASAIVVQIVNEIFGYFEAARITAQQAAGTESYLELISTMANNCR